MTFNPWGWGFNNGFGTAGNFSTRVRDLFGTSLIGYWPMNEGAGAVSYDLSPQKNNGAYTGVTLANGALPAAVGGYAPLFDGVNDYNNVLSAGLVADFSGAAGTMNILAKVSGVGVWTDSTIRYAGRIYVDGSNYIGIYRNSTNNRASALYIAGGTVLSRNIDGLSTTEYFMFGLTWDKAADAVKLYWNGSQSGSTITGLGTWAGTPATSLIGAATTVPANVWDGWLAHGMLLNKAATPAEMLQVAKWAGVA